MAALKTAPATTVSLAHFVLETQKKRCDKMIKDGWKPIWGVRRSLEWWSDLKCEKTKAKYGMYLCAVLINQQNDITPPPAHATIYRNVSALTCSPIVPGPQILNAPMAPVQRFQGHVPTVNTYSHSQSIAKYHHCFKDFKDNIQELSGNGFASFVDSYAVRQAEEEPFFDFVKRFEDSYRHYCEVKGDWTVTLNSDVMLHTAVSGLNSELKTLYFNILPPINSWLDFIQWGQRGDISLAEKRHYQKVSATRIAAVDGATGNFPNPHTNLTAPYAMSTLAGNTSHGNPPKRGHCFACEKDGH